MGDIDIVRSYDAYRKALKKCSRSKANIKNYENIVARIEIKLTVEHDKLKQQLKEIELKNLDENDSVSLLPCNENNWKEYQEIISKIKSIGVVSKQLNNNL